uniref:BTB domain-containing protein n=1 Tax=Tetranychus urticae TaxID=32264 RepID=T1JZY3_TETUR
MMIQLDESCFELLIDWVRYGWIIIDMDNVIPMYEVSDHLKIESIKKTMYEMITHF